MRPLIPGMTTEADPPGGATRWRGGRVPGMVAATALGALATAAPAAGAQDAPPAPLPREPWEMAAPSERALTNGARLLVVPQREMPFVTVSLVVPGGRTADPPERIGLAELTAALLVRGTASRTAEEIRRELEFHGAELEASAGADWATVSAAALTSELPPVMALMADVVLRPAFPEAEVVRLRRARLTALEADLEEPSVLADRAFLRAAYGDHPYGRLETSASLVALDRAAVVDFHRRTYRPGRALFVVAGDIAPERAAELLEEAFAGWSPGAPAAVEFGLPPLRHRPRVVLVHRTGADRAVLRVGHTVGRGDHEDWTALTALSRLLGGGPSARVFRIFRDERGLGPAAWTEARRRLDRGYLRVAAETRTGDVVAALAEVRAQLLRVRQEPVAMDELRETRDFLAGAFPLRLETPVQLATELATGRLLGLPDTALSTYRARVSRLDPADLQEVALRQIQPDELVYVVVGDARWYHDALTAVGDVTVVDPRGRPVAASALRLPAPPDSLDAGGLRPARAEYRVLLDGRVVGTVARTLEPGADGTMTYRGVADLGPQRVEQSVTFTVPGFEPRAAVTRTVSAELVRSTDVRVERGRLVGTVRDGGGGTRAVDRPFPEGAMITDMTDLVVWIAALEPGSEFRMSVVDVDTGAIRDVAYRVAGIEDVELPGGTVRAYRVEMEGADPQTVWARIEAPHVPLRIRSGDGPLVLELTSWTGPGPPPL